MMQNCTCKKSIDNFQYGNLYQFRRETHPDKMMLRVYYEPDNFIRMNVSDFDLHFKESNITPKTEYKRKWTTSRRELIS